MLKDERGQMSIDFLAGLSLFMLALLFLAQFIPGMFVPFQSETIDLSSVSYRTSVILVEDPGWWDNGTCNNTDWENHVENISRIGLAADREHPNLLDKNKINAFNNSIDDENLTQKLGLYRNISGNEIKYGYNISIEDNGTIVVARGDPIPEYGDVSSMKRIVWMQTGSVAVMGTGSGPLEGHSTSTKALIYINATDILEGILDDGIFIAITNFNITNPAKSTYKGIKLGNEVHEPGGSGTGYMLKPGGTGDFNDDGGYVSLLNYTSGTYDLGNQEQPLKTDLDIKNGNDTLEISLAKSVFDNQSSKLKIDGSMDIYIELQFDGGIEVEASDSDPPGTPVTSILVAAYKPTGLIVKVWQ
ncbi:MAG: hypothetical protein WBB67_08035 [bacterium]